MTTGSLESGRAVPCNLGREEGEESSGADARGCCCQRQDALSTGLKAGGSCQHSPRHKALTLFFVQPDSEHLVSPHAGLPAAPCPQQARRHTRTHTQPCRLESMQTYAAMNVKITSANMRVSQFMAFPSPCREEGVKCRPFI